MHWRHEVTPLRPVLAPLLGALWVAITLYVGLFVEPYGALAWPVRIASVVLVVGYFVWVARQRSDLERRYPLDPPINLLALRVFGTPRLADFIELTDRWRWWGPTQQLNGPDTAGKKSADVLRYRVAGWTNQWLRTTPRCN
jgi:hypothetical protein